LTWTAVARWWRPSTANWYTQPKRETHTAIVRLLDRREALGVTLSFGEVSVTDTVLAYQRRRVAPCLPGLVALDLPPTSFPTQALWFELDAGALSETIPEVLLGRSTPPSTPDCGTAADRHVRPLGHRGLSTNFHPQTGAATIFLYDGHREGSASPVRDSPLRGAVQGCARADRRVPVCGRLPLLRAVAKCGNLNEPLSRRAHGCCSG